MEEYVVEVVNLTQGKLYYLSKSFFDRAAACVYGQDYVRDHRQENKDLIYFHVVVKSTVKSFTLSISILTGMTERNALVALLKKRPAPKIRMIAFSAPNFLSAGKK